jgi:hypothetical protein
MNTPIRANSGQKRTWVQNVKVAILPLLLTVIIVLVAEASKADIPTWQEPHVVKNIISQTDDFVLGSTSVIDSRLYFFPLSDRELQTTFMSYGEPMGHPLGQFSWSNTLSGIQVICMLLINNSSSLLEAKNTAQNYGQVTDRQATPGY